jgi:Putative peptidoglycan binding domain
MATLIQGSVGQEVKNLQTALNYHLPNAAPLLKGDGIFGPRTRERVLQFQNKHQLKADGIVGPKTHGALYCFVRPYAHMFVASYRSDDRASRVMAVRDAPSPARLPPIPRMQLQFPQPFRAPPVLQPPRLEIDPRLLLLARRTKFELEAGQETSFTTDLGTGKTKREVVLFSDLSGTIWSQPFGEHVKISAGGGVIVEHRVKPDAHTEAHFYVFTKAEVVDILKIGPLDLFKLEPEAKASGKLGGNEPPEVSASVSAGPDVEVKAGKVTISVGARVWAEYKSNGVTHSLGGGGAVLGTFQW